MRILAQDIKLGKPHTIIFDWDNTLLDSLELICNSMLDTFSKFQMPAVPKTRLMKHMHGPSKNFISEFFPQESHDEVRKVFIDSYNQLAKKDISLLPKAREALEEIKKKNIKMAIVSNKVNILLTMELAKLGIDKYFTSIIGSGDSEEDKPSPLPVFKALKEIGVEPSQEVWFIGDSATDMTSAYNSECLPVFFGTDDYSTEHYKNCKPKLHFLNHAELIKYFSSLNE